MPEENDRSRSSGDTDQWASQPHASDRSLRPHGGGLQQQGGGEKVEARRRREAPERNVERIERFAFFSLVEVVC
jgi:hypothetical protein